MRRTSVWLAGPIMVLAVASAAGSASGVERPVAPPDAVDTGDDAAVRATLGFTGDPETVRALKGSARDVGSKRFGVALDPLKRRDSNVSLTSLPSCHARWRRASVQVETSPACTSATVTSSLS